MKMRVFDRTDWATFGGCESNEYSPALIREVSTEGADYVVIVDLTGLTIVRFDEDTGTSVETTIELPYKVARRMANSMDDSIQLLDDLIDGE
jgi:hypothetical protein